MEPQITGKSLQRLSTCDTTLQHIVKEANKIMELSVLCGVRTEEEQTEAFNSGASHVKWPNSKHNITHPDNLSSAVDIIPYFINGKTRYDWEDHLAFAKLAGVMFAVAKSIDVKIRWGGDWDMDGRSKDERFLDLVHFELLQEQN